LVVELKRILLAEDNANDLELTLAAFAKHRLANGVVAVRDGAEVLDYLYCRGAYSDRPIGHPALVVLDLKMPRVDGLEVLRQIKQHDELRRIPVVVLTSSREEQDVMRSYDLGVNAYVVKPVTFHEFIDAVGSLGGFWALVNEPPPLVTAT
jgi:CheY-like chemotaxis protein